MGVELLGHAVRTIGHIDRVLAASKHPSQAQHEKGH